MGDKLILNKFFTLKSPRESIRSVNSIPGRVRPSCHFLMAWGGKGSAHCECSQDKRESSRGHGLPCSWQQYNHSIQFPREHMSSISRSVESSLFTGNWRQCPWSENHHPPRQCWTHMKGMCRASQTAEANRRTGHILTLLKEICEEEPQK